jgi:hypothetical protein
MVAPNPNRRGNSLCLAAKMDLHEWRAWPISCEIRKDQHEVA